MSQRKKVQVCYWHQRRQVWSHRHTAEDPFQAINASEGEFRTDAVIT